VVLKGNLPDDLNTKDVKADDDLDDRRDDQLSDEELSCDAEVD